MAPATQNLLRILEEASGSENSIIVRQSVNGIRSKASISYKHLYQDSLLRSHRLKLIPGFGKNPVVLLYVNNHLDSIKWFWAIVAAGAVPCPLPAFSKDPEKRRTHFQALQKLFNAPIIVTTEALLPDFDDGLQNTLCVHVAERIDCTEPPIPGDVPALFKKSHELAVLMLTSGSTGEAKAVALTHGNILASLDGKSRTLATTSADIFLGWTGLDHVANLTEIHLHAMRISATQMQVHESMVVNEPFEYLQLLSDYKISCTFAPNFILTSMVQALQAHFLQLESAGAEGQPTAESIMSGSIFGVCSDPDARDFPGDRSRFDFSNLRNLVSGGEPNVVATCIRLTSAMFYFGAPGTFIRPALGFTESCAGAIYNMRCPYYDLENDLKYCSLGYPTEAMGVRITRDEQGLNKADVCELGYVLLSGPAMFEKYYNNLPKTIESFTHSGCFRTGDLGYIDKRGCLRLKGRDQVININGVKHYLPVIELTIDAANIPGLVPSYTVALAYKQPNHDHDVLVIIYLPNFAPDDYQSHLDTHNAITKTVLDFGVKPHKIVPLPPHLLAKSTLGKLPKNKIREAFQHGVYGEYEQSQEAILRDHHKSNHEPAQTPTEQAIIDTYHALFPTLPSQIGRHTDLFTIGVSSMDVLKMQYILQKRLAIHDIPLTTFFTHSILHKLAIALDGLKKHHEYNPVVILQPHGEKTPLWLLHPGIGEVLVFMPLARRLTDRPVYALRSRGFDGESFFTSMSENVSVFHAAIKRQQPHGPYALAGYSFGSILGFEIAKKMEAEGNEVKFLATFDQPPFFKARALGYDWHETILWISAFLGFLPESEVRPSLPSYRLLSPSQTITKLLSSAPQGRIDEVNMAPEKLQNWANLALQLKKNSAEWDPSGIVSTMDVFYTEPLRGLVKADTIEEWYEGFMSKWMGFVEKRGLLFWTVGGGHRTMIGEEHLERFLETFEKAMGHRGI